MRRARPRVHVDDARTVWWREVANGTPTFQHNSESEVGCLVGAMGVGPPFTPIILILQKIFFLGPPFTLTTLFSS